MGKDSQNQVHFSVHKDSAWATCFARALASTCNGSSICMLFGPFLAFKAQRMSKTGCLAIILAHSETYLILPTFTYLFRSFLILWPLVTFWQPFMPKFCWKLVWHIRCLDLSKEGHWVSETGYLDNMFATQRNMLSCTSRLVPTFFIFKLMAKGRVSIPLKHSYSIIQCFCT